MGHLLLSGLMITRDSLRRERGLFCVGLDFEDRLAGAALYAFGADQRRMRVFRKKDDEFAGQDGRDAGRQVVIEYDIFPRVERAPGIGAGRPLRPAETFGTGDHHLQVDITVVRFEQRLFGPFEPMVADHDEKVVALNGMSAVGGGVGEFVEVAVKVFERLAEKGVQTVISLGAAPQGVVYHVVDSSWENKYRDFTGRNETSLPTEESRRGEKIGFAAPAFLRACGGRVPLGTPAGQRASTKKAAA